MDRDRPTADEHPFLRAPHRTLAVLSVPVLFSLIAEPLTALADTAFVARLGSQASAALGVGALLLSSVFWIFNFLGTGTQTEVAHALGRGARERASEIGALAVGLALAFGVALIAAGWLLAPAATRWMEARGEVFELGLEYLRIRLLGAPAVLVATASFGVLRGIQDMRTPLAIAVTINAANVTLDWVLIFGHGPFPALGVAGAAWASVASQWLGAGWAVIAVHRRVGLAGHVRARDALGLLRIGRDLFLRTGLLTLFLMLGTRAATDLGKEAGAAHHAIQRVWVLAALVLDAFAASAQSLVGYFFGARRPAIARRVAAVTCQWSLVSGFLLAGGMLASADPLARLLVPPDAWPAFHAAWIVAACMQPLNALSFATDGIHWGTGDYRFLRNAMFIATSLGATALLRIDLAAGGGLRAIWLITTAWILVRAASGVLRIWPGVGASPLAPTVDRA